MLFLIKTTDYKTQSLSGIPMVGYRNDRGCSYTSDFSLSGIPMVGYRNCIDFLATLTVSLSGIPMVGYRNCR